MTHLLSLVTLTVTEHSVLKRFSFSFWFLLPFHILYFFSLFYSCTYILIPSFCRSFISWLIISHFLRNIFSIPPSVRPSFRSSDPILHALINAFVNFVNDLYNSFMRFLSVMRSCLNVFINYDRTVHHSLHLLISSLN